MTDEFVDFKDSVERVFNTASTVHWWDFMNMSTGRDDVCAVIFDERPPAEFWDSFKSTSDYFEGLLDDAGLRVVMWLCSDHYSVVILEECT